MREIIAEGIRGQADWRRWKAAEYQDPRNLRAAAGLERFADYIAQLPEDDPRLQRLAQLAVVGDGLVLGTETERQLSRFCFGPSDAGGPTREDFEYELDALVNNAEVEYVEIARFAGVLDDAGEPR